MAWDTHRLIGLVISLVIGLVAFCVIHRTKTLRRHQEVIIREGCKPPKCLPNRWFPPFGLDKLWKVIEAEKSKSYPLLMLRDHERYGDTYSQWNGPVYTIITRDPRNLRVFLSREFKKFEVGSARHGCLAPLLGDGIFTQDGSKWERSRKTLAPLIQRSTLPDLALIEKHFQRLRGKITPRTENSASQDCHAPVDFKGLLHDFALKITTEFLLGDFTVPTPDHTVPNAASWSTVFAKEFHTAFRWISKRERLKGFYWMIDSKEFRDSCRNARKIVDDVISRSLEAFKGENKSNESYIALAPLLQHDVDVGMVRDQFLNLLLAGRDTSASMLCWIFYTLSRESGLYRQLRAEVATTLSLDTTRKPTKSDLRQMTQLDHFISETLRRFPPVPINCRYCIETTTLPHGGGDDGESPVLVPRGTLIAFSAFATHNSVRWYGDDANQFRIDRWNGNVSSERMIDWTYLPFLGGPRKCLGERFALTQAKYLTCRFLQHFEELLAADKTGNTLQYTSGESWFDAVKYDVGLTMSPDQVWAHARRAT